MLAGKPEVIVLDIACGDKACLDSVHGFCGGGGCDLVEETMDTFSFCCSVACG